MPSVSRNSASQISRQQSLRWINCSDKRGECVQFRERSSHEMTWTECEGTGNCVTNQETRHNLLKNPIETGETLITLDRDRSSFAGFLPHFCPLFRSFLPYRKGTSSQRNPFLSLFFSFSRDMWTKIRPSSANSGLISWNRREFPCPCSLHHSPACSRYLSHNAMTFFISTAGCWYFVWKVDA